MLSDEKILITGPAGRIAYGLGPVARRRQRGLGHRPLLAIPPTRDKVEALGVTTRTLDLADGDFGDLPTDFTYLLHLVADFSADDYDRALRVNAEGTGFVLEHCRNAKAALVMSTVTVYKPHPDPWHAFREDDPLGDAMAPPSAPYSVSKIAEEGVARYCAAVVRPAGRPSPAWAPRTATRAACPVWHLDAIAAGEPVHTRWDPMPYSPIHDDDICAQLEPLLDAASVPATIVNWAGDEPVSVQEYSAFFGELLGVDAEGRGRPRSRARRVGSVADHTKRTAITGPCRGRLARRVPARGRALLPRPGAAGAEAAHEPTTAVSRRRRAAGRGDGRRPASTTSAPATSARDSTSCSTASSATPI